MKKTLLLLFLLSLIFRPAFCLAQSDSSPEILEAEIIAILEEKEIVPSGLTESQLSQSLKLLVTKGSLRGQEIIVETGSLGVVNQPRYSLGDQVVVNRLAGQGGKDFYYLTDFVRRPALLLLFLVFILVVGLVAGFRGLASLLGMATSFLVIFLFILPRLLAGDPPVTVAIVGSLLIIPLTFFLSHGFNRKTLAAVAGTFVSLMITGFLADFFVNLAQLTGFASEEAGFLQVARPELINMRSLLLAGIIIGLLGVLDDVTISQAAIVFQLRETNPRFKEKELYRRAMVIGRDHISSMVNTLILVYAGAALPLLLLFIDQPQPFATIINAEILADEIVRTLVGSLGLILAVPLTTFIASFMAVNASLSNSKK